MTKTYEWYSRTWGPMNVTTWDSEERKKTEVTVYCRVNEELFRYYRRNSDWNGWKDEEVNWNDYILGVRSLRFDFELELGTEVTKESVEELVMLEHVNDDLSYHVEPVTRPQEWNDMDNATLWAEENKLHRRRGELELELREVKRTYRMIWAYGDKKFDWASNL